MATADPCQHGGNIKGGRRTHHAVQGPAKACAAEVAHRPNGRPEPDDVRRAGQDDARLDQPTRETKLVPGRDHPALVIHPVRLFLRQRDLERAVLGRDRGGVVPLHVAGLPVVEVDGLPVRVVARVERAAVGVELVGEDELEGVGRVGERDACLGVVGGLDVDEAPVARNAGDLFEENVSKSKKQNRRWYAPGRCRSSPRR